MKIAVKIIALALLAASFGSCTKGVEFEEIPMDVQNRVGLKDPYASVYSRELFEGKVLQVNFGDGGKYVDILITNKLADYETRHDYVNNTPTPVNVAGQTVAPGGSISLKHSLKAVYEAGAPEDSVYIMQLFMPASTVYKTPNKGHVFDQAKFAGVAVQPEFINPVDGKSTEIRLPVDVKRLIVAFMLEDENACYVKQVAGAPEFGKPGDFSVPRRYIVENENNRNGIGKRQRLYEVRVNLLP